jgi:phosphoketolase
VMLEPEFAGALAEGGEVGFGEHVSKFAVMTGRMQPPNEITRLAVRMRSH